MRIWYTLRTRGKHRLIRQSRKLSNVRKAFNRIINSADTRTERKRLRKHYQIIKHKSVS